MAAAHRRAASRPRRPHARGGASPRSSHDCARRCGRRLRGQRQRSSRLMARFLVFQEGDARVRGLTDNAKAADALAKELARIHGARFYVKRKPDRNSSALRHSKGEKKMARKKAHGRKKGKKT